MGTTPDALVPDCYLSLGIAVSLYKANTANTTVVLIDHTFI